MHPKRLLFQWLDFMVSSILNPAAGPARLGNLESEHIARRAIKECQNHKRYLKMRTIGMRVKSRSRLISQYRMVLLDIHNRAFDQLGSLDSRDTGRHRAITTVLDSTLDLLNFIESYFGESLVKNQLVAASLAPQIEQEIRFGLQLIKSRLEMRVSEHLISCLINELPGDLAGSHTTLTIAQIAYFRKLMHELEHVQLGDCVNSNHQTLLTTLLILNFNATAFIKYYTENIKTDIAGVEPFQQKLTRLLFYHKEFNQLPHRRDIAFDQHQPDAKRLINNWFVQEITYLKDKDRLQNPDVPTKLLSTFPDGSHKFKVLCFLSVDQMALILRSMDALRIFQARSLNVVIQSIAPFLSTARKQEISWESMRNKAYSIEESDRKVVIKTLESMIKWIEEHAL